jgi:hypothetical protein
MMVSVLGNSLQHSGDFGGCECLRLPSLAGYPGYEQSNVSDEYTFGDEPAKYLADRREHVVAGARRARHDGLVLTHPAGMRRTSSPHYMGKVRKVLLRGWLRVKPASLTT